MINLPSKPGRLHFHILTNLVFRFYHSFNSSKFYSRHGQLHKSLKKSRKSTIPFIKSIKEVQDPNEALNLFHKYHQMGFKHDYPSYAALIYRLARSHKFEAIETILNYIENSGIRCGEMLFTALFQHYGKGDKVEKAIKLFNRMPSFNCARTLQSFNAILNVLVDNSYFLVANQFFDRSRDMGFRPNSVSFNILIKGCLGRGEWEEAVQVLGKMLARKVQPTVVTYNSLIGFLCKKGDLDRAWGLIKDMIEKGRRPNAATYALLMEGFCTLDNYKEAEKIIFDMEYRGCKPELVNYGVLLSDLGKRGKIEEAKSLLLEMKKKRLKPDVVAYNILINYLCKVGRVEEAYKLLVKMQVEGCEANAATFRMVIDGFCRARDFAGGFKILNAMLMRRHVPRMETFCCLVAGLFECGKSDDARFVLEEMENRRLRLDLEVWRTLVSNACGEDGAAINLVGGLIARIVRP